LFAASDMVNFLGDGSLAGGSLMVLPLKLRYGHKLVFQSFASAFAYVVGAIFMAAVIGAAIYLWLHDRR